MKRHVADSDIAIVGMSCRLPGAGDIATFWRNLRDGVESIRFFTDDELIEAGVDPSLLEQPNYVRATSYLDDIDKFDAGFFGISPRDAAVMDPQHRLFLQCAWEALEDAGIPPGNYPGSMGVYGGSSMPYYLIHNLMTNPDLVESVGEYMIRHAGNEKDFVSTRVSYCFDLKGPSVNVQTACSTGLVVVHMACQALLGGECDAALAGGVALEIPQDRGYLFQDGGIQSPDGHCRTFDADAKGTVFGSGAGIVVLKRATDAVRDGDRIYALIKGSAINNDGSLKVGYLAPSIEGQAEVIRVTLAMADVPADSISYVEAHGTGTVVGDPIEVTALTEAYRTQTDKTGFCAIGSVKTNIGHLSHAAGTAGLIKTALALHHRQIPPSLHFKQPNPQIDFPDTPFCVNAELAEWTADNGPRRAGVSAMGIGGTNAHVILEEAPLSEPSGESRPSQLLVLSAKTPAALDAATSKLAAHLHVHTDIPLADVAYTTQVGRSMLKHRRCLVAKNTDEAVEILESADPRRLVSGVEEATDREVVFMFTGQGSQYVNMGKDLYTSEAVFRKHVDEAAELLQPILGLDLREVLYPSADGVEEAQSQIDQTWITQPALFVVEYALARLWMAWGLIPKAMIGHSIGEYVAACLADVMSFGDALRLVAARGRLMQDLPSGSMLAVGLPESDLQSALEEDTRLSIAALNSPLLSVASGADTAIDGLEERLTSQNVMCRRLRTSHAFHSAMMEPAVVPFTAEVAKVALEAPRIPFVSNVTGAWAEPSEVTDPAYWGRHIREAVRFSHGLETLMADPNSVLVEVGPGQTLSTLSGQHPAKPFTVPVVGSLRSAKNGVGDLEFLLTSLGRLWLAGVRIDWTAFYADETRHPVSLPTYPFEARSYWIEPGRSETGSRRSLTRKPDVADWFYLPSWKKSVLSKLSGSEDGSHNPQWVIFTSLTDREGRLEERLGPDIVRVVSGPAFEKESAGSYVINPREPGDYVRLLSELQSSGVWPGRILHLWNFSPLSTVAETRNGPVSFDETQYRGFYSLLFLAQAMGQAPASGDVELVVVSDNMQPVSNEASLYPEKATLLGPVRVIPREYPSVRCRSIDFDSNLTSDWQVDRMWDQLTVEIEGSVTDPVVAYRGADRWVEDFEAVRLGPVRGTSRFKDGGVYLITGGSGGIGFELAQSLARSVGAKLVLVSRNGLSAAKVRELESLGAEVAAFSADVADSDQMEHVLAEANARFGPLNGVIHTAGVMGEGIVQQRTVEEVEVVFGPKIHGARVLDSLLGDATLDFFVLFSSTSSFTPVGQADYSSANAFLDAFAQERMLRDGSLTIAVDWGTWKDVGMAVNAAELLGRTTSADFATAIREGIPTTEGLEALERILAQTSGGRVVVSSQDLSAVRAAHDSSDEADSDEVAEERVGIPRLSRPELETEYVPPASETEKRIAAIWEDMLGIEEVGIHDDFFELGGHSLVATQLIFKSRNTFGVDLRLSALFDAPTVSQLATLVDEAQGEESDVRAGTDLPEVVCRPADRFEPFPLTDIQQAYFIGRGESMELGGASCHGYSEVEIEGLDPARFERALQRLIERHDVLRAIVRPDGQQQVLEDLPPYQVEVLDLRGAEPGVVEQQLEAVRAEMSHRCFAPEVWPLYDFRISLLDGGRGRIHISLDFLFSDVRSYEIFIGDLGKLYREPELNLPALVLSFRDYVLTAEKLESTEIYQRSRRYWLDRLETLPPAPELPTAKTPGDIEVPRWVRRTAQIDASTWSSLKNRATQSALTHSGLLVAATSEVLSAWSKSPHFTLNLTLFNRLPLHDQVDDILGDFTSSTLLEVDAAPPGESFDARALRLQKQLWKDIDHRYFSGVRVIRELARQQKQPTAALMPVVFTSLLNLMGAGEEVPAQRRLGEVVYGVSQTPQVALDIQVYEDNGRLMVNWDTVDELYIPGLLDDMLAAFVRWLEMLANSEDCWGLLWTEVADRLLPDQQRKLQEAVNTTAAPVSDALLHTRFIDQVSDRPDAPAVIAPGRTLSYSELRQASNQLAHQLRVHHENVRPNALVGVVMEKGWEQVAAVLGILEAGAAYLPIDASLPRERIEFLLRHGEVGVVVTQPDLDQVLDWPEDIERLVVTLDSPLEPVKPLEIVQNPEDLAYVIFTSGSTGLPKGVMIDHRGAVNTIFDINQRFDVGPGDRVLALSSLSFDLSVYDIFGVLAAGGAIVMPEAGASRDPLGWGELVAREHVTVWNTVPALMELMVDHAEDEKTTSPDLLHSLRVVMMSGDWIPLNLPNRIRRVSPGAELYSLGGATEASIWSILYPIDTVNPEWKSIPYGMPMVNQKFYVLDDNLTERPHHVPGDLYIGGIGLAQGYWRDEEKTNASFIVHPRTGERLYRTGDLGRYLPDGNIEFLGREDFQVKIRGYRVELGEIQAALEQHPVVDGAVITVIGDQFENKRLIGYVVPKGEGTFDGKATPDQANERLWGAIVEVGREYCEEPRGGLEAYPETIRLQNELSIAYICSALRDLGVFGVPNDSHSVDELIQTCGLKPHLTKLLGQWLDALVTESLLERSGDRFVSPDALPQPSKEALRIRAENHRPIWDDCWLTYICRSGDRLVALLRGEQDPLELLFPDGSTEFAESFYQTNRLATYFNTLNAEIVRSLVGHRDDRHSFKVLEIGAGIGSTTASLLPVLPANSDYVFTDLSIFFTNLAKEKFRDSPFVQYGLLNIEQEPGEQGYELNQFDLVVASNVLHGARDISAALENVRALLAPGGSLLLSEATANTYSQMVTVGFIEGFTRFSDERMAKNSTLLSAEEWCHMLKGNGFDGAVAFPQPGAPSEVLRHHVIVARYRGDHILQKPVIDRGSLREFLKAKLPEYMIPTTFLQLREIPLTGNGKVDLRSLPAPRFEAVKTAEAVEMPLTDLEKRLIAIWAEVLKVESVSVKDNFFDLEGDSIVAIQIASKARKAGLQVNPSDLFDYQTVAELAEKLEAPDVGTPESRLYTF